MILQHHRQSFDQRQHSVQVSTILVVPCQPCLLIFFDVCVALQCCLPWLVFRLSPGYWQTTFLCIPSGSRFSHVCQEARWMHKTTKTRHSQKVSVASGLSSGAPATTSGPKRVPKRTQTLKMMPKRSCIHQTLSFSKGSAIPKNQAECFAPGWQSGWS